MELLKMNIKRDIKRNIHGIFFLGHVWLQWWNGNGNGNGNDNGMEWKRKMIHVFGLNFINTMECSIIDFFMIKLPLYSLQLNLKR